MHPTGAWRIPSAYFPIPRIEEFDSTANGRIKNEQTRFDRFAWRSAFEPMRAVCFMR